MKLNLSMLKKSTNGIRDYRIMQLKKKYKVQGSHTCFFGIMKIWFNYREHDGDFNITLSGKHCSYYSTFTEAYKAITRFNEKEALGSDHNWKIVSK